MLQDVSGLRMSLMNRKTVAIFKAVSLLYQAHYPVRCPPWPGFIDSKWQGVLCRPERLRHSCSSSA